MFLDNEKRMEIISRLQRRYGSPPRICDNNINTFKKGDVLLVCGYMHLFYEDVDIKNQYVLSSSMVFEVIEVTAQLVVLYGELPGVRKYNKKTIKYATVHFSQCKLIEE